MTTGILENLREQVGTENNDSFHEEKLVEFFSPSEIRNFTLPEGCNLIGDYHIFKGEPFVIGGAPSVGKSRSATALAIAGATQQPWFGYPVHRKFKTMILQAENGKVRLKDEFAELNDAELNEFVRICPPPPYGFAFYDSNFCKQLGDAIEEFLPDVFILDPWNRHARDDKGKDCLEAFNEILSILPTDEKKPALGIIHHTRKPKSDEKTSGRSLLNLLAGSYVLGSIPRSVFIMQAASDDPTDDRVVWTCCKNNNGALGDRSAWRRHNGLFELVTDFAWEEFDGAEAGRRIITEDDLQQVFSGGALVKSRAVKQLQELTGLGHTACYNALSLEGRFKSKLKEKEGLLSWE